MSIFWDCQDNLGTCDALTVKLETCDSRGYSYFDFGAVLIMDNFP